MHDHPHEHRADAEHEQDVIIIILREQLVGVAALEFDQAAKQRQIGEGHAQAIRSTRHPEEFVGQRPQHLRQCQRQDAEEYAGVADTDIAERRWNQPGQKQPNQNIDLDGADAEIFDQEGGRVSAEAEISRMTERKQAGVAKQQIEPERRDCINQAVREQLRLIDVDKSRQHQEHDENRNCAGNNQPCRRSSARRVGLHRHALPNRPVGFIRRTRAEIRKRTASSISEKNWTPPARKKLTKGAPKKAPARLPSPPMTTTTNARINASTPMPSTAACAGTTTAPPRPAMKQPSANAWMYTHLTLRPSAEAMRIFCDVALRMPPNLVR